MPKNEPKEIAGIEDLTPDDLNANKGTERGRGLLEKSLRKYGAGRSIVTDRNGKVIAGNKTLEAVADLDLDVEVVQTSGDTLVVVQRTDIESGSKEAVGLGIADNRVAELSLAWDAEVLEEIQDQDAALLGDFFRETELARITKREEDVEPEVEFSLHIGEAHNYVVLTFDNEVDWLAALTHFGLKTVAARRQNGKPWSMGVGRVIDGAAYLKHLRGGEV